MSDLIQYQIFKILKDIYKNDKFFENHQKYERFKGYLIEKREIDKIKNEYNYDLKIKPLLQKMIKNELYENIQKNIKEKNDKIKEIVPKKYNNSNELKKELKNKSFIIIKQGLMSNLCNTNILKGKDLEFKFENDSIFIIFTDNDKLNTFINNGVIGKNKIEQISSSFSSIKAEIPIDNIKCKKDLEILIRIFYYNKYLREKENTSFKDIIIEKTDENNIAIKTNEIVYLINNLWMKEYKSYYEYQDLTNYLRNKNEYLTDLSNEIINKIIDSLPIEYISKINKKIIFDKNKIFIYQKNKFDEKIFYLYNNHIINSKIYDLFKESGYKIVDSLIKFELYFVGNNKILLYFSNKKEIGKYVDEIGFINEKGTFIPEYLLDFSANNITSEILNDFFNDFSNLFLDNNCNFEIKNRNKEKIGNCFKLNNITNSILINKVNNEVSENSDNIIFEEIKSSTTTNLNENNKIHYKTLIIKTI